MAVTVVARLIVTVQVAAVGVPPAESQPFQVAVAPSDGAAVSVTTAPWSNEACPLDEAG